MEIVELDTLIPNSNYNLINTTVIINILTCHWQIVESLHVFYSKCDVRFAVSSVI